MAEDKVSANQRAKKAITELQLVFDGVPGNQKKQLNKMLVKAVEELRIIFNKDAEHFFSLCKHLDHNEILEWTNRRAGMFLF